MSMTMIMTMKMSTRMKTQTTQLEFPLSLQQSEVKFQGCPTITLVGTPSSFPARKPSWSPNSCPTSKRGRWRCTSPLTKQIWNRQRVWWKGWGYIYIHTTVLRDSPPWGHATNSEYYIQSPPMESNWLREGKYWSIFVVPTSWEWPKWEYIFVLAAWRNVTF